MNISKSQSDSHSKQESQSTFIEQQISQEEDQSSIQISQDNTLHREQKKDKILDKEKILQQFDNIVNSLNQQSNNENKYQQNNKQYQNYSQGEFINSTLDMIHSEGLNSLNQREQEKQFSYFTNNIKGTGIDTNIQSIIPNQLGQNSYTYQFQHQDSSPSSYNYTQSSEESPQAYPYQHSLTQQQHQSPLDQQSQQSYNTKSTFLQRLILKEMNEDQYQQQEKLLRNEPNSNIQFMPKFETNLFSSIRSTQNQSQLIHSPNQYTPIQSPQQSYQNHYNIYSKQNPVDIINNSFLPQNPSKLSSAQKDQINSSLNNEAQNQLRNTNNEQFNSPIVPSSSSFLQEIEEQRQKKLNNDVERSIQKIHFISHQQQIHRQQQLQDQIIISPSSTKDRIEMMKKKMNSILNKKNNQDNQSINESQDNEKENITLSNDYNKKNIKQDVIRKIEQTNLKQDDLKNKEESIRIKKQKKQKQLKKEESLLNQLEDQYKSELQIKIKHLNEKRGSNKLKKKKKKQEQINNFMKSDKVDIESENKQLEIFDNEKNKRKLKKSNKFNLIKQIKIDEDDGSYEEEPIESEFTNDKTEGNSEESSESSSFG